MVTTQQRPHAVTPLLAAFPQSSARRACRLVRLSRSRWQHHSVRGDDAELRTRLRELAAKKPRWGYQQLHELLRREGRVVNHKKVFRLYREEGLAVSRRRRKKHVAIARVPLPTPTGRTERWSMDCVSDALANGQAIRCFTLVDDFTRECPTIEVAHSLPGWRVIHALERVGAERGFPKSIACDNGPEFAGKAMDRWAYEHGIVLQFIRPGKPIENAYCERFTGTLRDECLNANWFTSLADAPRGIERWRREYNEERPHTGLDRRTPAEFAKTLLDQHPSTPTRLTA